MRVLCESCKKEIDVSHVDLKDKIAKCEECNIFFDCSKQLKTMATEKRDEVTLPKKFEVTRDDYALKVKYGWFSPAIIALIAFCVFWDGFMVVWYWIACTQDAMIMALFGGLHALVGVSITYFAVASCINKTTVIVTSQSLDIEHGPLPFKSNKSISVYELKQLFTKEKVTRNKNGTNVTYDVLAITKTNGRVKLLSGFSDMDHALYIEQEIEKFLNIKDAKVKGEVPR